jgi:hypothetical protein
MRLAHRVRHLERLEGLAPGSSPLERFQRALNEAALRLTGKCADELSGEAADLVISQLTTSFFGQLNEVDMEALTIDLERIAFGGDAEALAAAEREVLASLDAESRSTAVAPGRPS